MRSKKRTIGILIVVIVLLLGFAGSLLVYRNKLSSENTRKNSDNNIAQSLSSAPSGRSIENFYDKPITDEKIALDSIEMNRDKLGYSDKNFTFRYDKKSGSETAYHFDLYYKDIPVYEKGVGVFTHYSDNSAKVLMSSVSDAEKIIKVNTIPKITEDEAFNIAKETLGENFSEYNIGADFKQVKNKPKLTIYKYNDEYNLAYYIQSVSYMCVINAENGDIIEYHSTAMSNSAQYEGQKGDIHEVFYDDYKDEKYDIKNALWNKDKDLFIFDNCIDGISLNYILKLDDIKNGNNKSAVDGMANTYRAMEYFEQENFNVSFNNTWVIVNNDKSKDGNGKTRKDNATGQVCFISDKPVAIITFDLRSKKNNAQLSAYLDIVGHEYTHTITGLKCFGSSGYNTDSKYFEQNALMEAYSDIFGQLIEQKYTGKTDWIQSVPDNSRNLKKTKTYSKRRKTKDDKGTEKNDYGYAHDNSTIISHIAYLMSNDNDSQKYDTKFLLDYNQLAQLWYGSLEYLKKTEFKDFADCRYAIEESARDLIKKGVLIDGNLKIIEQAFNEVEVSSNPARRGAMDSAEIKEKHTLVVPIEDETQSSEPVEITEPTTLNETELIENWKQLYADKLREFISSNDYSDEAMFDLYDIDNDGNPELFISEGGFLISFCTIYTIYDGKLIASSKIFNCIYSGGIDNLQLQVSQSTKTFRGGGIGTISYQKLENGQFISIFEGNEHSKEKVYTINGKIVPTEKYEEEVFKYKYSADDYINVGRKYKLEEETISSVLLNMLTSESTVASSNNFNINNYEGTYHSVNSDFNLKMELKLQSESLVDIEIIFTNSTGTKVSENSFSGSADNNILTFETDDGFGKNTFILEFKEEKIYLSGKCIDCYSDLWGLPEMNNIEMQIE